MDNNKDAMIAAKAIVNRSAYWMAKIDDKDTFLAFSKINELALILYKELKKKTTEAE